MKKLFLMSALALLSIFPALGQATGGQGKLNNKSEAGIRQVVADFMAAWNQHDAKAFSMVFAPDAEFTNVLGVSAAGRDEIERFHAPRFTTTFKNSHQTMTDTRTRFIKSDVAAVDVRWEMTGATDTAGNTIPLRKGLLNFVMVRAHNNWVIAVMHNMNLPTGP
ncbi:MAG: SgcJ/EcaC family oxidoreductase [Pyrinomonadaceae bacterium]